jgi:hypothetical protein
MSINVKDLCGISMKRYNDDIQIYKTLIHEVFNKIKERHASGKFNMLYRVPRIVIGHPRYDFSHASYHIMKQLVKGGFVVIPNENNNIYIDWSVVKKLMFSNKQKKVTFCLEK